MDIRLIHIVEEVVVLFRESRNMNNVWPHISKVLVPLKAKPLSLRLDVR